MFYCNNCGRCFCSNGDDCCPYCGCHCVIIRGPQGIQGETGPQGIQGETGPQGIQGETGPQGIQGETGPQGIQGETGPQGIQGETGPQGIQGETGPQGIQGETGPQGIQGETGPQGIQGETGPQGIQGDTGPQGIQGDSAENYTTVHLSAIHTGGISLTVPLEGVAVPMQNTILSGFTVNATFDTFTADFGGVYLLIYNIKTSVDTTVKTRIMRNGTQLSGTIRSTSVPSTSFSLSMLVRLTAGDQLQLQLYDLNNVVIGLQGGTGASMVLVRLSE